VTRSDSLILPNLGAEEGEDWRAYLREPATRMAAQLFSHLFSGTTRVRTPSANPRHERVTWIDRPAAESWPPGLGARPAGPAYAWLESPDSIFPWFRSEGVSEAIPEGASERQLVGPTAEVVAQVHDKAFALEAALSLDLLPTSLSRLIRVLGPRDLARTEGVIETLEADLARWPDWTGRRFTLKPRLGSSGRGRIAGVGVGGVDTPALRGALPRLAARGGAILEPWLERRTDLSVCLLLPEPADPGVLPTLLGSTEMLSTASGGYRGHCGEIDHRGRVFSGHSEDETLRAHSAAIAARAQSLGYFGPCGVDSFVYVDHAAADGPERLRPGVEFNARATMGLVALGLLRRLLPAHRNRHPLEPGERRAFLLGLLNGPAPDVAREIADSAEALGGPIFLADQEGDAATPQPVLFFAPQLAPLREAYRRHVRC
jgi:hypothetical protein